MSGEFSLLDDACSKLPHTKRKMFGGHGFFAPNGGMFALARRDDVVIFKLADETARTELEALGGKAWGYEGKNKAVVMKEWIIAPLDFFDEPELMEIWAKRAHRLVPAKKAVPKKNRRMRGTKS